MPIDFEHELNPEQLEAVRRTEGPVLVIAGAGSGKTRTIVYRLAHLVESGVPPEDILLLTFTRKAAQEMLLRAGKILDRPLTGTSGGTYHSFAFAALRRYAADIGHPSGFTLLDRADSENVAKQVKEDLALGKGDRSYPKKATLLDLITKSRNKEATLEQIIENEAFHLAPYLDDARQIAEGYETYKRRHALMDYDDLLFLFEKALRELPHMRENLRRRHRYIMVDEYQDTNLVQARIVQLLAGENGNVMAVGDDAQSIYAFRGANVANILHFPKIFPETKIIRLERNYRSTQPILDLTNKILEGATVKFDKHLYTERADGEKPALVTALSDQTQAKRVIDRVLELRRTYPLHEIAVLFRAGFHSYSLEVELGRIGIGYQKFGGLRFHEAAHVKDVLAYLRLVVNPADLVAWQRALGHIKGVGPKTALKIVQALLRNDEKYLASARKKYPDLESLLYELDLVRSTIRSPAAALEHVITMYTPLLVSQYPDDYPRRQAGLEQLGQIAANYKSVEEFLADMLLDETHAEEDRDESALVLSTIHSAKGLEWKAVILIDLVEDRFPSKRAMSRPEDLEEERRLLYVACTRAKDSLTMFLPATIYNRYNGTSEPTLPSPFLLELPPSLYETWTESYSGGLQRKETRPYASAEPPRAPASPAADAGAPPPDFPRPSGPRPEELGFCTHKIFGRGKIIAFISPNKYRVNFPGFGLKVIVGDYLEML